MKLWLMIIALACSLAMWSNAGLAAKKDRGKGDRPKVSVEEIFKKLDTNGDGKVAKEEYLASPRAKKNPTEAEDRFKKLDKNNDGCLSLDEFKAGFERKREKKEEKKPT